MISPFKLAAVGDIVLTRPSIPGSGVSEGLATVLGWLDGADVRFANLETVYSERGYPREKLITLRGNPKLVDDLKQMHVDVLSVANNHSVDFGEDSLLETIRLLEDSGIRTVGGGADLDAALAPAVIEVRSTRVGFMAASCLLPVGSAASADRPGLAPIHIHSSFEVDPYIQMEEPGHAPVVHTVPDQADLSAICARIAAAREGSDFLAVSVHMGRGFGEDLAEYEPLVGHALIDAGADVVFGNHVHAIHGIESYAGRAILYSPGNFVAQQAPGGAASRGPGHLRPDVAGCLRRRAPRHGEGGLPGRGPARDVRRGRTSRPRRRRGRRADLRAGGAAFRSAQLGRAHR